MVMSYSAIVILVMKMKGIVITIFIVKMALYVEITIAHLYLVLTMKLVVVTNQLLEMKIFVHLEFLVEKMKEIAILTMNAKQTLSVTLLIIVQHLLDSYLMWIVVLILVNLDVSINE